MPIFTRQLGKVEGGEPQEAVKKIADHIRLLQEQLEWRLSYLDSSNISEIDANQTNILMSDKPLQNVVTDLYGNMSLIEQTAAGIQMVVQNQQGDISALQQTAQSITATVESYSGDISQIKQTAASITATVQSQSGDISQLKQTSASISASVQSMESGLGQTVRIAADGVTITNASGSRLTIDGGQINATNLNLTGHISFSDLNSSVQTTVNNAANAYSYASTALNGLQSVANGTYRGGSFIDGKNIYSPNLYGDTINLLDGSSNLVGTMSMRYSQTFAFDITSNLSLRFRAASGYNAYMGVSNGPYIQCETMGVTPQVQIGGGVLVLTDTNFGTSLPYSGVYGQVYFLFA